MSKKQTNAPITTGQKINTLLQEQGKQKKAFAVDIGVSPAMVSNWISGKYNPSPYNLGKIAEYFGVDVGYLAGVSKYRTEQDARDHNARKEIIENIAINNFLSSRGYHRGKIKAFFNNNTYGIPLDNSELILNDLIDAPNNNAIYEITTPAGENKYIKRGDLLQLVNDFFTLLDTRIIDDIGL